MSRAVRARQPEPVSLAASSKRLPASLRIGEPGDAFEREADRVADAVMSGGASPQWSLSRINAGTPLQRKCECGGDSECEECKKKGTLQRRAAESAAPSTAPAIVDEVLRSPGQPLDGPTRAFFEPRLGHDFSRIRIHADSRAAESARAVAAEAYTLGEHVAFGAGRYSPSTTAGKRLIAHELTHVVQQSDRQGPLGATRTGSETVQRQSSEDKEESGILGKVKGVLGKGKDALNDVATAVGPGCLKSLFPGMTSDTFERWIPMACARTKDRFLNNREWDAFGHCWIGCEGTRHCGGARTWAYGTAREIGRELGSWFGGEPHDSFTQDRANQQHGRTASKESGTCFSICDSLEKDRVLDLSAPVGTCVDCSSYPSSGEGPCPPLPAPAAGVTPPSPRPPGAKP